MESHNQDVGLTTVRRRPSWPLDLSLLFRVLPLLLAGIYVTLFAVHLPRNLLIMTWSSDSASGYTIPETVVRAGTGGDTILSASGQWISLWFGLITARLPLHRALWEVAPVLAFIATGLAVAWAVHQIAGPRAAAVALLLGLMPSALAVSIFMSAFDHNSLAPLAAAVDLYLIWLTRRDRQRWAVSLAMGLIAGVCLASDALALGASVAPMGFVALLLLRRREPGARRIAFSILTTVCVALPTAELTNIAMYKAGYRTISNTPSLVSLADLPVRTRLMAQGLWNLFNGYLVEGNPARHIGLGIACTVSVAVVLPALLFTNVRSVARFSTISARRSSGKADLSPPRVEMESADLARSIHVAFWTISAITLCGMVWLTAPDIYNLLVERYYVTVVFSVAATLPLVCLKGALARTLAPIGLAIFLTGSLVGLGDRGLASNTLTIASEVTAIARAEHATTGYAEYDMASDLTWNTHGEILSRPIVMCPHTKMLVCRYPLASVPAWYAPQRRRTFLLVARVGGWAAAPSALGRPIATFLVELLSMFVYGYDIASRIGPAPPVRT